MPTTQPVRQWPALFAALALSAVAGAAQAQSAAPCGDDIKAEVAAKLAEIYPNSNGEQAIDPTPQQLEMEQQLYNSYAGKCAVLTASGAPISPTYLPGAPYFNSIRQCAAAVTYVGSLFYEEMSCCGYDPQKRSFACPVRIKRQFGYGASPFPGSFEYVLNCVADAAGVYQPVALNRVHLSDNNLAPPSWQFAVIAPAQTHLNLVNPLNQATRRARSILSWGLMPTGCNYQPIWGNTLEYRIRLDQ